MPAPALRLESEQTRAFTPGRGVRLRSQPDFGPPGGIVRHLIVRPRLLEIQLRDQRQLDRVEARRGSLGPILPNPNPGLGRRLLAAPDGTPHFPQRTCLWLQWAQQPGEDQQRAGHRPRGVCAPQDCLR
jgi:hypothetical protein